jgi:ribosomal protein S18 acetylase RimI-like enzyme
MNSAEIPIRRAGVEDASMIARLLHDFNTEFETETPGVAALSEYCRRLLAEDEMTVILGGEGPDGLALLRFRPSPWTGRPEAYLQEFYVVPAMRGQGIGSAILTAAIAICREAGATGIDLNTAETDIAARALYEKFGFTNKELDGSAMLFYEREI